MIAVDTNILVRLLVNDDVAQAARAKKLFDAQSGEDGSIWVSDTVLVELVWSLARAHGRSRADLVVVLRALASNATVSLESPAAVRSAVEVFARGNSDFADCLLSEKALRVGCSQIFTFDKDMRALSGVTLL